MRKNTRTFRPLLLTLAGLALLAVPSVPRPASACSCIVGLREGFLFPEKGEIPANARGLLWWTGGRYVPVKDVKQLGVRFSVERIDGKKEAGVPFAIEWIRDGLVLIAPKEGLEPGARYRFSGTQGDFPATAVYQDGQEKPVSVRQAEASVSSARLLPQGLAPRLDLGKPRTGKIRVKAGASCSIEINSAQQPVKMVLPPWLERWKHALTFRTEVDGKPWEPSNSICTQVPPGESWVGKGEDLLYAGCPGEGHKPGEQRIVFMGDGGLEPGEHTVRMFVELPGTRQVYGARASFELDCESMGVP